MLISRVWLYVLPICWALPLMNLGTAAAQEVAWRIDYAAAQEKRKKRICRW